jgi:uncharacterized protein with HEPN domain
MTLHEDSLYARHMFESAQKALIFVTGKTRDDYQQDEVLWLALMHLVQTIGEAARNTSKDFQSEHPEIPWKSIMGIRHRIVHNYTDVDEEVIWRTINDDLAPLIQALEPFISLQDSQDDAHPED